MNLGVNGLCSHLGYLDDGYYVPSDDCEDVLVEFFQNLIEENPVQRSYRRQLCFSRVVELDVIPLIKFVKDQPSVFIAAIRFFATLLQPIECLTLGMPSDIALPWLSDVKRMLINTKRLCTDKDFIAAVTSEIKTVIQDHDGQQMDDDMCDFINKCLLMFRNLLHIHDVENDQDTLVLFLLECDIGDVINQLVNVPQREYWCASIIQLVSLMYTRQTLEILKPSLNLDSDEEDKKFSDDEEDFMLPNCTYCEDVSNVSTSHSLTGLFGKTLQVRETPNEDINHMGKEDVSPKSSEMEYIMGQSQEEKKIDHFRSLLLKFTRNFIDDCFGFLVHDLKNVLLSDMKEYLDDTYFLWAMAFFLKIARKENLPLKVTRLVMTSDLIGFLVYEGVVLSEQLLIAQKKKHDPTKCARRLHLTVNAIKESLKTLSQYSDNKQLDEYDREYIIGLQKDLANLTDLRMVFILLIRRFRFKETGICFLEDLIITNHILLELVDSWQRSKWITSNFSMLEHVKQYGTRSIMGFYGILLENFETNSHQVNKCVFTMMHHVAGDCQKPEILMQMHIIQALMEVDGTKNHFTKEMNDLTEYLLNRFANLAKNDPYTAAVELFGITDKDSTEDKKSDCTDSSEIDDHLFTWYTELQNEDQMVDKMVDRFEEVGITVSDKEIWSRLFTSGLISESEYLENKKLLSDSVNNIIKVCNNEEKDVVKGCVDALKEKKQEKHLKYLQFLLCETAYVKLGKQCDRNLLEEPVTMYHVLRGSSVPVVLYTEDQEALLTDQHFNKLLHYLGFHTPQDVDMVFPRIPSFWTSEQLIKQAEKLGPISKDILKFDPSSVKYEDEHISFTKCLDERVNEESKEVPHNQIVSREGENNVFWLKQIQLYNDSQQLTAK